MSMWHPIWSETKTFLNFKDVIEDYNSVDAHVKTAVLKASSSVASILTRTGTEVLFIGSGTIIECDEENHSTTILTSATLLRGPEGASSIPSDLRLAVGGPLINCHGEVIGVNFLSCPYNVFIPINIVSKCLEGLKRNGKVARPWLGARIANLYTADLKMLDNLHQKFPNVVSGVMVGQGIRKKMQVITITRDRIISKSRMRMLQKSPAVAAGLCSGDVIIKCGEVPVHSHLEFVEALWDKEEKPVELVLVRPSIGQQTVTLTVGTCPEMPRWDI